MKLCPLCNENKTEAEFCKCSARKDGLSYSCRICKNKKAAISRNKYRELEGVKRKIKYQKDPTSVNLRNKIWRSKNKKRMNELVSKWKKLPENVDKVKSTRKKWNDENRRLWNQKNPDRMAARNAKRRADKLKRTPKWLTKQDYEEILKFYTKAQELSLSSGVKYEVDHIVPLRGKSVSGLHVPWNLQVITKEENILKKNKF